MKPGDSTTPFATLTSVKSCAPMSCRQVARPCSKGRDRLWPSRFGHRDLTNFGQSIFGHRGFGPANFGQSQFWPIQFWPIQFFWPIFLVSWWGPEGVGGRMVGARMVGAQNFALFSLSRHSFSFFSPSLLVFVVEFWWCLKRRDAQMCAFGVLWLSCASPGGPVWWGRRGFTRQPESPNVHI